MQDKDIGRIFLLMVFMVTVVIVGKCFGIGSGEFTTTSDFPTPHPWPPPTVTPVVYVSGPLPGKVIEVRYKKVSE